MARYSVVEENNHLYGISASDGEYILTTINNVFSDYSEAKKYVDLFNENELDIIHLEQVISDYLLYGEI